MTCRKEISEVEYKKDVRMDLQKKGSRGGQFPLRSNGRDPLVERAAPPGIKSIPPLDGSLAKTYQFVGLPANCRC